MPLNPDEIKTLLDNIIADLNTAADLAGIIDPRLIPFIQIGQALDKQLPGLAVAVTGWIEGNPPTTQEKTEFARQLSVLGNPDLP